MLSTWPQELGFLDTRLKCKAAGNSGLLAQRSQARKISRGSTPGRRWSHTRTERTSATRGSSLWETLKAPKSQSVLYHSFPNGHETPCIHLKMVIFAEFSPRLHCHVAQYVNSSILWFSLHRQALLVRRTLLVCYNKREKEAAIQSHKNLHSHDTYSLSRVLSLCYQTSHWLRSWKALAPTVPFSGWM